jgi:hypothetical protein
MLRLSSARFSLWTSLATSAVFLSFMSGQAAVQAADLPSIYRKENLVAWCIVPFDASNRGPEARAEMLQRLGIRKVAYDWREQHVPTFEDEIVAYKRHGLEYFAFWDVHDAAFALFKKHQLTPQIWKMIPEPQGTSHDERVQSAAMQLVPLVRRTHELGCQLGLYNHGGWTGEPANMAAVCQWLREHAEGQHVGIVYNFHHGHEHIASFNQLLSVMQPYLLCININGMNDNAQPKILPLGAGQHEVEMMRIVQRSGYRGPIGIIHHREQMDAEVGLRENLDGLKKVLKVLGDQDALKTFN